MGILRGAKVQIFFHLETFIIVFLLFYSFFIVERETFNRIRSDNGHIAYSGKSIWANLVSNLGEFANQSRPNWSANSPKSQTVIIISWYSKPNLYLADFEYLLTSSYLVVKRQRLSWPFFYMALDAASGFASSPPLSSVSLNEMGIV
ncbi:MAG: hypothetical protein ACTTJD_08585, partial [Porphyromonadaceae bacterium]